MCQCRSRELSSAFNLQHIFRCFSPLEKQVDHHLMNRMKVCFLGVILMWSSTLRVAVFISQNTVVVPVFSDIFSACRAALSVIQDERTFYIHCVDSQGSTCQSNLESAILSEEKRIYDESIKNEAILEDVAGTRIDCLTDYDAVRTSLEMFPSQVFFNDKCSQESIDSLMQTFMGLGIAKNDAISLYNNFTSDSKAVLDNIVQYTQQRIRYNLEYLTDESGGIIQSEIDSETCNGFPRGFDSSFLNVYSKEYVDSIRNAVSCSSFGFLDDSCEDIHLNIRYDIQMRQARAETVLENTVEFLKIWGDSFSQGISDMEQAYTALKYTASNFTEGAQRCYDALQTTHKMFYRESEHSWLGKVDFTSIMSRIDPVEFNYDLSGFNVMLSNWQNFSYDNYDRFEQSFDSLLREANESIGKLGVVVSDWNDTFYDAFTLSKITHDIDFLENYNPPIFKGSVINISSLDQELEVHSSSTKVSTSKTMNLNSFD